MALISTVVGHSTSQSAQILAILDSRTGMARCAYVEALGNAPSQGVPIQAPQPYGLALYLVAALCVSACCRPAVQQIYSVPVSACAHKPFTLHWSLRGEAVLSASQRPPAWESAEKKVEGSGELPVVIETSTDFTLFAPRAKPSEQSKVARVALVPEFVERSVRATCDNGKVHATLNMSDLPLDVRVRQIRDPVMVFPGSPKPAELCVTHGGQSHCLKPGEELAFPVLAGGDWELTLANQTFPDCEGAPSQLGMHMDFDCD